MTFHTTIHPSSASTYKPQRLASWVQTHPLRTYFLLAFAGSWLTLLPVLLGKDGFGLFAFPVPTMPVAILMPFLGPTLAALVITALSEGQAGVGRLLRRYQIWRVGWQWYLLVLFGPPLLLLLGATALFGSTPLLALTQQWPRFFTDYLANLPFILILGGPLGEEPGWRGFALPRLQARYGALAGSLILGVLHGLWHLPLFFIAGAYAPFTIAGLLLFVLGVLFNAIIWTWIFNNTQGSLLLVTLLHAAVNGSGGFVQALIPATPTAEWIPLLAYGSLALLVIAFTNRRSGH